jgi:hypothetical protein
MTSQPMSPLPVGQVLENQFRDVHARITIHSARELTVEVIAGDDVEFSGVVLMGLSTRAGTWCTVVRSATIFPVTARSPGRLAMPRR